MSRADAQPVRAHLQLQRPAQGACPTAEDLQRDVEALAGRTVFTSQARGAGLEVHCVFEEEDEAATAHLRVHAADGELVGTRELSAPAGQCHALRRPLSLVLVMLLEGAGDGLGEPGMLDAPADDARVDAPADDEALADRTVANAAGPQPPPSTELDGADEPSRPLAVGASLGVLSGVLPRAAPGLGGTLRWRPLENFDLRVAAAYWLPVRVQAPGGSRTAFQALTLGLGVCPGLLGQGTPWGLALCVGAQAALVLARPRGLEGGGRTRGGLGQGVVGVEVSRRLGRARLAAGLGLGVAFARPTFFLVQGDGSRLDVHQPDRWGAIFRLTVVIGGR